MNSDIQALINALDTGDVRAQSRAGDQLIAAGAQAIPELLDALSSATPRVRRSAAFLLGRQNAPEEVIAALSHAVVEDPEPKVRKNAAVSLGRIGAPEAVGALVSAMQQERVGSLRPSFILALGAIGGEAACAVLRGISAQDDAEREALRKALDRCTSRRRAVDWRREGVWQHTLLLDVPVGLETVALNEAAERGLRVSNVKPGLLRCPPGLPPWETLPALRCVYGPLIDAGQGPPLPFHTPEACATAAAALIAGSPALLHVRDWLTSEDDAIRYRFSVDHKQVRRETLRATLEAVRAACLLLGLIDSPSNYDIELRVSTDAAASNLSIRPSFMEDTRFAYRQKDVGASINPVVAACLARLVRSSPEATVFDPTCGSGTLLVERALLDEHVQLIGLDISRTAVAAAKTNARAAGLGRRMRVSEGDATQPEGWPFCGEVIANLPFGMRTRRAEMDLVRLYGAILAHLASRLKPGGRALLYTANRKILESSLSKHKHRLHIERHLRVLSGGLWSNLWILTARR